MLDDDTITKIVARHGVVALHFAGFFVCYRCARGDSATVEHLVDEIDYFKRNNAIDNVALGPDYIPWRGTRPWIAGVRDMTELRNVAVEMVLRGYTEPEVRKVLGDNLLQLYSKTWK